MAEWLCSGLQIRVRRFDSGSCLHSPSPARSIMIFGHAAHQLRPNMEQLKFDILQSPVYKHTSFDNDALC